MRRLALAIGAILLVTGCSLDPIVLENRVCRSSLDCLNARGYYCLPSDSGNGSDGGDLRICVQLPDAGDAGHDAAPRDASRTDASAIDADVMDAGTLDVGPPDASSDAGIDANSDAGLDAAPDDANIDAATIDAATIDAATVDAALDAAG